MFHTWQDLLFLHWSFDPDIIQATLPEGLTVDTYDGRAWLGVVPFFMRNIRPRWAFSVPWLSNFQELNLRTYAVDREGTPGVWFYSLDANCWPAVQIARRWYHLPYRWGAMSFEKSVSRTSYSSRLRGSSSDSTCRFEYEPAEPQRVAEPGTLEFFLIERYVLFSIRRNGSLRTGRVWHEPYQIARANVPQWDAKLFGLSGLPTPEGEFENSLFSPGVDVEVFGLM